MKTSKVGDYVIFGTYEQDNNKSNGKEYIEWLVLEKEDNRIFMISRYALDFLEYETHFTSVTWKTCYLREWLNGTFLNAAFSPEEQNSIIRSTVWPDRNPYYGTSPGSSTIDKIFLLSIPEVNKYFSSNSARQCQGTEYCYAQKKHKTGKGNCSWWLRSPGSSSNCAAYVEYDGHVINGGISVDYENVAVRPALWISLGE